MSLKWTMPFPGACWQLVMDGYSYYIQDVDLSGSMVAIYRHPAGKTESHKFLTFRDMYKSLFGTDAPEIWDETAIQIEMRRRGTCHYGLWSYTAPDALHIHFLTPRGPAAYNDKRPGKHPGMLETAPERTKRHD